MFVSGFTFVRNAIRFDYPIDASIRSILPLVDELVICLGNSEDATEELIRSIGDSKIRIINSVWDDSLRTGGRVLAVETDKALQAVSTKADWCIYLQADEVIHQDDYVNIRQAMEKHLSDTQVEGLLFDYLHFYGSYAYVGDSRRWYRHEVRVVRNDARIHSFRDAQGFRIDDRKIRVKKANARIFHYGWVKDPLKQLEKQQQFHKLWHDDATAKRMSGESPYDYLNGVDSLAEFTGSHPSSISGRVAAQDWEFTYDTRRKKLRMKDRLLYAFERLTGIRLFEYRNYTLSR
jgi:glycosyltransferase involved in cell wall biosynthesis